MNKVQRTCDASSIDTICHVVELPPMCPVSGNPAGGSLRIEYSPARGVVLDVDDIAAEIHLYVGGRGEVRDMERTIQRLAEWAAGVVGALVAVRADMEITTVPESSQRMVVTCERRP